MGRLLVIEYDCDGKHCGVVASEPYQDNYTEECDDLEKSGWAIIYNPISGASFYCPKCKSYYGG